VAERLIEDHKPGIFELQEIAQAGGRVVVGDDNLVHEPALEQRLQLRCKAAHPLGAIGWDENGELVVRSCAHLPSQVFAHQPSGIGNPPGETFEPGAQAANQLSRLLHHDA
jgi:hypothetical protein